MGEILYDLVIQPIWLLLEMVFKIAYSICDNPGISVIFVSLVVNILVLPLYLRADAVQAEERNKQKQMEAVIRHFRKTFKGDERFLVLSTFYRQNDYQPWYALRSSLSLLLQIPFFMAAYDFLSNLQLFHGVPFLFIKDLGLPDATFMIGSFPVNVLPVLMTAINLVSSFIYTKGGPLREKIQTVGLALIFLVLLYNSPSGLVFYWTLNNLFSLGKNAVMFASKHLFDRKNTSKEDKTDSIERIRHDIGNKRQSTTIWLLSSFFITVLVGIVIPVQTIDASPLEFIQSGLFADPTRYALTTTATSAGLFLVWGGVIYYLCSTKAKSVFSTVSLVSAIVFLANYMCFTRNFGLLWDNLVFSGEYRYTGYELLLNSIVILEIIFILIIVARNHPFQVTVSLLLLTLTGTTIGAFKAVSMSDVIRKSEKYKVLMSDDKDDMNVMNLSKKGKNVVVLILDRAISGYLPFIMQEKPDMAQAFDGFVYYPNTVSFGEHTIQAAPALYGGYEYTTFEIDQRDDETLRDKINESITLLPRLFSAEGYHSVMCDVPMGNLKDGGDTSVFDNIDNCEARVLTGGAFWDLLTEDEKKATSAMQQQRNFFYYSLCRVMPLFAQSIIYDDGMYNALTTNKVTTTFANSYAIMKHLSEFTVSSDNCDPEFVVMHNYMTHEEALLDSPDYVLKSVAENMHFPGVIETIDGKTMHIDNPAQLKHYDVNVSAYQFVSEWIKYLKDMEVYDNTRIIIVSDHGYNLAQFDDLLFGDIDLDAQFFNPLLLVKDFDARGVIRKDDSFMTNADVPSIAVKNIIEDPRNPYTGGTLKIIKKDETPQILNDTTICNFEGDEGNTYDQSKDRWFSVHSNIFDRDNWALYEP